MFPKRRKGSNFIELYKIDAVMVAKAARKEEIQIFNTALDPCGNLFDLTTGESWLSDESRNVNGLASLHATHEILPWLEDGLDERRSFG
jgi:hypothetical protein